MLEGRFDSSLVVISVLVAVFASYTALSLSARVSRAVGRWSWLWTAGGAFAMGTGIWAMHFVGMLAFRLPIPIGYDVAITAVSWVLPVGVSGVALWQATRHTLGGRRLAQSALLIGAGINAMHYVGMAAMRMSPGIDYDPLLVLASIVIAVVAATAALLIAARLRDLPRSRGVAYRIGAAVVMGLAIVGMHYTGMAAARFPAGSVCRAATGGVSPTQLAVLVIVAAVGILGIALLATVYDARLDAHSEMVRALQRGNDDRTQLLERERRARAEAERLSAMKDEFLATLSHELRTPLNAILGWLHVMRAKDDDATRRRGLEIIERNARLQATLIEDLLDMSRIVSGQVRLELAATDAAEVLRTAIETVRPEAQAKRIRLDLSLAPDVGRVWADAGRLHQIVWNLLSNAVKFTPEGGEVRVALARVDDRARIEVRDNGVGIAPEFLPHVFEPFRQADASASRRHGGLGLGLSIVRQLVELHGGTVQAESAGIGRGATFALTLPLYSTSDAEDPPTRRDLSASAIVAGHDLSGLRVLLVDDEPDGRRFVEEVLRDHGAEVVAVASAAQALERLRVALPDVLLSDIAMPEMDGYALVRALRAGADPAWRSLPAIALTAFTRDEDERRAREAGFNGFARKPLDVADLLRTLDDVRR